MKGNHRCSKKLGDFKSQKIITDPFDQKLIAIDRCIFYEILYLWACGIRTLGSCCGHNKISGYIWVDKDHIQRMLHMGYEVCPDRTDKTRQDSFLPMSV